MKGLPFYRSIFYLPSMLGSSVAIALLWRQMFGTDGLVNQVLRLFGFDATIGYVSDPSYALGTIILLHVWTFGSPMVIFLAGLRQIPGMYYEAAVGRRGHPVDPVHARSPCRCCRRSSSSTWCCRSSARSRPSPRPSWSPAGPAVPSDSTMFYTVYLYQKGFGQFQMGYAAAMAWLLVIIIAAFTAINFFASKYWVFYGD